MMGDVEESWWIAFRRNNGLDGVLIGGDMGALRWPRYNHTVQRRHNAWDLGYLSINNKSIHLEQTSWVSSQGLMRWEPIVPFGNVVFVSLLPSSHTIICTCSCWGPIINNNTNIETCPFIIIDMSSWLSWPIVHLIVVAFHYDDMKVCLSFEAS